MLHEAQKNFRLCSSGHQQEAKPIPKEIKTVLEDYKHQVLLKSPTGKAIAYPLNQWEVLNRYVDNPMLEIDNNLSERTLRLVVIGRIICLPEAKPGPGEQPLFTALWRVAN